MKSNKLALVLLLLAGATMTILPVRGQSSRFIIQNADAVRDLSLDTPSTDLWSAIDRVAARVVLEFADANRHFALQAIPSSLDSLLADIQTRIVIQFADSNRELRLAYPIALIGDSTPPLISQIGVAGWGDDSAVISWTTNEFADSTVRCGTASGVYTMTFFDPLYVIEHAVTLTGLTAGTTYYCRCISTDLSGNTTQSSEFSFEHREESLVYLPLVLR